MPNRNLLISLTLVALACTGKGAREPGEKDDLRNRDAAPAEKKAHPTSPNESLNDPTTTTSAEAIDGPVSHESEPDEGADEDPGALLQDDGPGFEEPSRIEQAG